MYMYVYVQFSNKFEYTLTLTRSSSASIHVSSLSRDSLSLRKLSLGRKRRKGSTSSSTPATSEHDSEKSCVASRRRPSRSSSKRSPEICGKKNAHENNIMHTWLKQCAMLCDVSTTTESALTTALRMGMAGSNGF